MSETPSNDELKNEINAAMAEAAAQQEPSSEETAAEVIELDLDEAEVISSWGELEEMIATKEQEKAELTAQLQRLAADFENYKSALAENLRTHVNLPTRNCYATSYHWSTTLLAPLSTLTHKTQ